MMQDHRNLSRILESFFFFFCVLVGSLASCSDPNIIREVLDFLLSSEVSEFYIILGIKIFSYKLINYGLMELGMLMRTLFSHLI